MQFEEEQRCASLSNLLPHFTTIHKAWLFKNTLGIFSFTQPHLLTNQTKTSILSCEVLKQETHVKFHWAPFPLQMPGDVSMILPSPSGSKLLVIRNPEIKEDDATSCFQIWSSSCLEKEFHVPQSIHGSVYNDGWLVI